MDQVKKLALVPADLVAQLAPPHPLQLPPPLAVQLSRLDTEIKKVLDNATMAPDVKFKMYQTALHQFNQAEIEKRKPHEIKITNATEKTSGPSSKELIAMLGSISIDKQAPANTLAKFLEGSESIKWDAKGRLLKDGMAVHKSNIHDLFDYLTRNRQANAPPGYNHLARMLIQANVPRTAIGNRNLHGGVLDEDLTDSDDDESYLDASDVVGEDEEGGVQEGQGARKRPTPRHHRKQPGRDKQRRTTEPVQWNSLYK